MENKEIIKNAEYVLEGLTFIRDYATVSIADLGTLELVAYGKLSSAVLFYHESSPYMITFIENYTNELNEAIKKIEDRKEREKELYS